MNNKISRFFLTTFMTALTLLFIAGSAVAYLQPIPATPPGGPGSTIGTDTPRLVEPGDNPDYLSAANWAYTPVIRKFVDPLPNLCVPSAGNGLCDANYPIVNAADMVNKNVPVAIPDIVTYPGSDYYELELVEFEERMHSDLPPTRLRGYRQVGMATDTSACSDPVLGELDACTAVNNTLDFTNSYAHYLGPVIVAQKDRPVRVKMYNKLPVTSAGGDLFVPVDQSIMGSGEYHIDFDPSTIDHQQIPEVTGKFTQNRGELHLHGGRTPWISDGTPHQWITPAGDTAAADYPQGVSVVNVSDMPQPEPGDGWQTYYWTNQQSARLMFYHDHAWGITRLNVYVGEAAGYVIQDETEQTLVAEGILPQEDLVLVVQDKSYVDATLVDNPYDPAGLQIPKIYLTDPTWRWGSSNSAVGTANAVIGTISGSSTDFENGEPIYAPKTGDLWWPHVYMPAQNPFDITGIAPMGRWAYGPYFWPATNNPEQPVANPYYNEYCDVFYDPTDGDGLTEADIAQNELEIFGYTTINGVPYCQPFEVPSTPNPSWGAEAFMDTPTVNGTAYPVVEVEAKAYRIRILNAAHDRFFNLSLFESDPDLVNPNNVITDVAGTPNDEEALTAESAIVCATFPGGCATDTEVRMVPAAPGTGLPATWPLDGREGGVPDPTLAGPNWVMIGSEGGLLPRPVEIPPNPVNWNADVTTFNAGNVNSGSLILGPAERADVVVDFSGYAPGDTIILYNDAPAPWPAEDPHYSYFTGAPDLTDIGGYTTTPPGVGPNVRTVMQFKVKAATSSSTTTGAFSLSALMNEFKATTSTVFPTEGAFQAGQDQLIVGQGNLNPTGDPAFYEAFAFEGTNYNAIQETYDNAYPTSYPNWGISQINSKAIHFYDVDGNQTYKYDEADNSTHPLDNSYDLNGGVPLMFKAIQDEQGETFDDYGRMRAGLGIELINAGNQQVNFMIQTYSDPATEILEENGIQVWKITHNGVDTHPVHFHLYDVQVINRVGWDGFVRLPDPTEMGWKDTLRISPLEDTIVALKPVTPRVPFGVPESYRPLNPAVRVYTTQETTELTQIDPFTGEARVNLNRVMNFDWEYVWHCHILSHEENDMMRPQSFLFAETAPSTPVLVATATGPEEVTLNWSDPTPPNYADYNNPAFGADHNSEIGFIIERRDTPVGTFAEVGRTLANKITFTDSSVTAATDYEYRVIAYNAQYSTASLPAVAQTLTGYAAAPDWVGAAKYGTSGAKIWWATSPTPGATYVVEQSTDGFATITEVYNDVGTQVIIPSGLTNDTYQFRVKTTATSYLGSDYKYPATSVTIAQTAIAPAWVGAGKYLTDGAKIWWAASPTPGATYVVEQSTDGFATITEVYNDVGTQVIIPSGLANGTYQYRVKTTAIGYYDSGPVTASSSVTIARTAVAPAWVGAGKYLTDGAKIWWAASPTPGATYVVEQSTDGFATSTVVYNDVGTEVIIPSGLSNGTYQYRVKTTAIGYYDSGPVTASSSVTIARTAVAPAWVGAGKYLTDGAKIWWAASPTPGATYVVEQSTDGFTTSTVVYNDVGTQVIIPSGLASGTYQYRVKTTSAGYFDSPPITATTSVTIP